jgi:transcriptional regulator with XRE-family HTH domain
VGANVRLLREAQELTQAELVQRWSGMGLHWARSKLSALEAGRRPVISLGELWVFATSLDAPVSRLVAGKGSVTLAPTSVVVDRGELAAQLGQSTGPDFVVRDVVGQVEMVGQVKWNSSSSLEARLARQLNVSEDDLATAVLRRYGRDLIRERDARIDDIGPMTVRERTARRGHVTRQLVAELRKDLEASSGP